MVIEFVSAKYSCDSFPTLMSAPCWEVREALRINRFVDRTYVEVICFHRNCLLAIQTLSLLP